MFTYDHIKKMNDISGKFVSRMKQTIDTGDLVSVVTPLGFSVFSGEGVQTTIEVDNYSEMMDVRAVDFPSDTIIFERASYIRGVQDAVDYFNDNSIILFSKITKLANVDFASYAFVDGCGDNNEVIIHCKDFTRFSVKKIGNKFRVSTSKYGNYSIEYTTQSKQKCLDYVVLKLEELEEEL